MVVVALGMFFAKSVTFTPSSKQDHPELEVGHCTRPAVYINQHFPGPDSPPTLPP